MVSTASSFYRESVARNTSLEQIDNALNALRLGADTWAKLAAIERKQLFTQCLQGMAAVAPEWSTASCLAKGNVPGSALEAEDWLTGPVATARCLRLIIAAIDETEQHGLPRLPRSPRMGVYNQLHVPVFPGRGLYDSLLFQGFKAEVRMAAGVPPTSIQKIPDSIPGVCLILGAGNVSSIPITDTIHQLWNVGRTVLLKMNPVNEYLGPIFERAFAPLIENNFLRIVYGGAEVGQYTASHAKVNAVHITGSIQAHEALVWGEPSHREERKSAGTAVLAKPITSELGNVTPWIVVPGRYSRRQLVYQAENLAATIVNNASFNCIATKMIVTCRQWHQRDEFLDCLQQCLATIPPRKAYYPGAADRYQRFTNQEIPPSLSDGHLPWALRRNLSRQHDRLLFEEESFTCVCGETTLDADSPERFLATSVDFANSDLWGSLACTIMVPNEVRRQAALRRALDHAIARLRYGTVAINHWAGIAYGLMSTPWGGAPGGTLADPQSGIDWVHNPYLLHGIEKSILIGPLASRPKPPWFPSHRSALPLAQRLFDIYRSPTALRLIPIFYHAVRS